MKRILQGALGVTALSLLLACGTTDPALQSLQGSWEGVGTTTLTITGNSLHFQGLNETEWYDATFTLPAGTNPPQLRATITGCQRTDYIGTVVPAIFKIEDGTLTLAVVQGKDQEPPKSFDASLEDSSVFRYELRKVQPQT